METSPELFARIRVLVRRRAMGRHGRPVGGAGLQPAGRRVGVPAAPLRAALPGPAPGGHGQDRLQRRLVRARRVPPAAVGGLGDRRLRVHAARSGREGPPLPRLPLARHRRHRAPRVPDPHRLLHPELGRGADAAHPGGRAARTERGPRHPPDGLLRGGRPRRRADPPGHGDRARARGRTRGRRRLRGPRRRTSRPSRARRGLVDALPVVEGELQWHAVGCYSVHADLKLANARRRTRWWPPRPSPRCAVS